VVGPRRQVELVHRQPQQRGSIGQQLLLAVAPHQRRISGPLLDRIDITVDTPRVPYEKLAALAPGEDSAVVRARVEAGRAVQLERLRGTKATCNAEMTPPLVRRDCQEQLLPDAAALLRLAVDQFNLSARAYHRVLKLSRTIADLAASERIAAAHVAEALQYRRRDG
jgi:magnesium chelatase family protein